MIFRMDLVLMPFFCSTLTLGLTHTNPAGSVITDPLEPVLLHEGRQQI